MNKERIFAFISVLLASNVVRIVAQSLLKLSYVEFAGFHALLVLIMLIVSAFAFKRLVKLNLLLLSVNAGYFISSVLSTTSLYASWFDSGTFIGQFGGSILLKMAVAGLVAVVLLALLNLKAAFLSFGDLKVKADGIGWLGIPHQRISWGKLALISAILISLGTFLGTVVTVTGFTFVRNTDILRSLLPYVLIYALGKSLFEGILYRNTIIASLSPVLSKNDIVILGALFFGVAHYFGAPGGPLGVVMSSALGWYMCRSMVETKGLFAPWLIHFFQDVVIFAAVILLGGFGL